MEQNELLLKLAKLREELQTAVKDPETHVSKQSVDLNSYLHSQRSRTSIEYPTFKTEYSYWKLLLDEKQQRIDELEDSLRSIRVEGERKENEIKGKYEDAIHSIKINCESLSEFYELKIQQVTTVRSIQKAADSLSFDKTLKSNSLKHENSVLSQENEALKKELALIKLEHSKLDKLKSEQEYHIYALNEELHQIKEQLLNSESELHDLKSTSGPLYLTESIDLNSHKEIKDLNSLKDSLEKDITSLEIKRSHIMNEIVSDYDSKLSQLQNKADFYKAKYKHVLMKFFTLLRTLKMDLFEVKHRVITWLEEALTETSTIVAAITRYHKIKVEDLETCMQECVKENHKLRKNKPRKGIGYL